jgi:hypothetical protein
MSEERIRQLLELADKYYAEGRAEYEEHPGKGCEAVWGSVDAATRALALKVLGRELRSEGETWNEFLTKVFSGAGVEDAELKQLLAVHEHVRRELYAACFYGGRPERETDLRVINEEVPRYLSKIKSLVVEYE